MNDLDQLLSDAGHDLTLDAPVSSITRRGTAIRRRRRSAHGVLAGTAVLAVTGTVIVATAGSPNAPGEGPTAGVDRVASGAVTSGWSATLDGVPAENATAYEQLCGSSEDLSRLVDPPVVSSPGTQVLDSRPVASTVLDSPNGPVAVLIYREGDVFATCTTDAEVAEGESGSSSFFLEPRLRREGAITPIPTCCTEEVILAAGAVAGDVAEVQVDLDGRATLQAAVENGTFAALLPPYTSRQELARTTLRALDADGDLLGEVPLLG